MFDLLLLLLLFFVVSLLLFLFWFLSILILPTPRNLKFKRNRLFPATSPHYAQWGKTILYFNETRSSSSVNLCRLRLSRSRSVGNAISPEPSKSKPLTNKNCVFSTEFDVPSFWIRILRSNLNKLPYYYDRYTLLS